MRQYQDNLYAMRKLLLFPWYLLLLTNNNHYTHGFVTTVPSRTSSIRTQDPVIIPVVATSRRMDRMAMDASMVDDVMFYSSSWIISVELNELRQYVPLVVILGVLVDIVLGSPLANSVLKPMRDASGLVEDALVDASDVPAMTKYKERVDSEAIAREAYDQAMGVKDLREYLEKNKTEKQKMEELRSKIDRQLMDDM